MRCSCKNIYSFAHLFSYGRFNTVFTCVIRSLTFDTAKAVIEALVVCHLDWFNSLLYDVPEYLLRKVQSVQNAAAHLLTSTWYRDHITPVLHQLYWLPVQRRVEFIAYLIHQSFASTAPSYLSADIRLISEHGRPHLRSSSHRTLVVPRTRTSSGDRSFAAAGPTTPVEHFVVYVTTDDQLRTV